MARTFRTKRQTHPIAELNVTNLIDLGFMLLIRTRRRVELTPAGDAFLRDARAILSELDGAVATARQML